MPTYNLNQALVWDPTITPLKAPIGHCLAVRAVRRAGRQCDARARPVGIVADEADDARVTGGLALGARARTRVRRQ